MCQTTAFDAIRKKYRVWQKYAFRKMGVLGVSPTYVYSHENPDNCHPHVNWVVHVPACLESEFRRKLSAWVSKVQGDIGPFDIKLKHVTAEKGLGKYIVKGADPEVMAHFHLDNSVAPQGDVFGKRAGHSPSIGLTERKKVGFNRYMRREWKRSVEYQQSFIKAA